ncbi:MAG: DNA-processing protein DprA [Symbiobacterium sp.]|uniref:DNA-processing protein DprA n=1 Tax=Symbiobacterium sp. TaxID=1971213 RepID=UPI003464E77B
MESALVWLIYGRVPGVGRQRMAELLRACDSAEIAWQLGEAELAAVKGWNREVARAAVTARRSADLRREAERDLERARRAGLRVLCYGEPGYPERLKEIPVPPPVLYQHGPWEPDARPQRPVVAIVGTRRPTSYGLAVAEQLARELAQLGAVVISGMARGIDTAAHRGALGAGGISAAVLGGGADVCYPRESVAIYRQMKETGAIFSEQPPGSQPRPEHFPERNRIISGLSHAVILVEAGERSGTLITAQHAIEQCRELFIVPGPITSPLSRGLFRYLRDGAGLAISGRQVLEDMGFLTPAEGPIQFTPRGLTELEQRVLGWMGDATWWPGDLAETCGLSVAEVQACLTMLEIRSAIRRLPDGQYTRIG